MGMFCSSAGSCTEISSSLWHFMNLHVLLKIPMVVVPTVRSNRCSFCEASSGQVLERRCFTVTKGAAHFPLLLFLRLFALFFMVFHFPSAPLSSSSSAHFFCKAVARPVPLPSASFLLGPSGRSVYDPRLVLPLHCGQHSAGVLGLEWGHGDIWNMSIIDALGSCSMSLGMSSVLSGQWTRWRTSLDVSLGGAPTTAAWCVNPVVACSNLISSRIQTVTERSIDRQSFECHSQHECKEHLHVCMCVNFLLATATEMEETRKKRRKLTFSNIL